MLLCFMSRRDPARTLRQILDFCIEAQQCATGVAELDFAADRKLQRVTERLIELIGEAASRLPEEFRGRHPGIPWGKMVGMRNRLIHGYDVLDYEILWKVLSEELKHLRSQIEIVLKTEFHEDAE